MPQNVYMVLGICLAAIFFPFYFLFATVLLLLQFVAFYYFLCFSFYTKEEEEEEDIMKIYLMFDYVKNKRKLNNRFNRAQKTANILKNVKSFFSVLFIY